jgi:UDP:flavonoid glycosyltransferase YjiC (YdhE family)
VYLAKEAVTPARLREAVQRVLGEDGFRRQSGVISESFRSAGGVTRAADSILRYVS